MPTTSPSISKRRLAAAFVALTGFALTTLPASAAPPLGGSGKLAAPTQPACPAYAAGSEEIARHGLPIEKYQCEFDRLTKGGYEIEWLDMFDANGHTYVNLVAQPAQGPFAAFHAMTGASYQAAFDKWVGEKGYRLTNVDSYFQGGQVRYAATFSKTPGPAFSAFHGVAGQAAINAKITQLRGQGLKPHRISMLQVGGQLQATGIFIKTNAARAMDVTVPLSEYQSLFDAQVAKGFAPIALNGFTSNGKAYVAAVFGSDGGGYYRHGLTGAQYQTVWSTQTGASHPTRFVTAYNDGGVKYAAGWGS